ncbi:MAG: hypothetical protein K0S53_501 [Bacteroidetes bacterium]|jgi:hypothetical protein|nr:hypothetical protein [Bacteroidota bacterium]MDF2451865.1 hypothetical protein [Bacteroidota bacterium]
MKSKAQKQGVTRRKKAVSGISQLLRDGSEQRNRRNDYSSERRSDTNDGRRRYTDNQPSNRNQDEHNRVGYSSWNDNEGFNEEVSYDRFNDYASHRDQFTPRQLRYGNVDGNFYNYMQRNGGRGNEISDDRDQFRNDVRERNHQGSQNDRRMNSGREFDHDYQGRFNEHGRNSYGEHPDSGGAEEYHGSNKRHPGLVGHNDSYEGQYREFNRNRNYSRRDDVYEEDEYDNRRQHDARFDDGEYLNRGQYEKPFHGRDHYDPEQNEGNQRFREERDYRHSYRNDGFQSSGNTEGFGIRGRERHGQDWLDEDQYRRGHAQRKNGYGKFGSR